MHTVLVVEDNADLLLGLRTNLELEGYAVLTATDGAVGLAMAREHHPDLVILDLSLPIIDGIQVLGALRREGLDVPVLILTARADEVDKILGFRLGADDYVTKPFGVLELMARVAALLRRATPRATPASGVPVVSTTVTFGDVTVDMSARSVWRAGREVPLAPKAFDLLIALLDAHGAAISRLDLLERVWGYSRDVTSRTVDSHIAELRRKLEGDAANPSHILTVRKTGYRLRTQSAASIA